jgi:hypothetical protein
MINYQCNLWKEPEVTQSEIWKYCGWELEFGSSPTAALEGKNDVHCHGARSNRFSTLSAFQLNGIPQTLHDFDIKSVNHWWSYTPRLSGDGWVESA